MLVSGWDLVPSLRLRVYPRETVFAEKLEAMVVLGMTNSRMKDYFDLLGLVREERVGVEALAAAVTATFARRDAALPAALPIALTESFVADPAKQRQWNAFLSRNRLQAPSLAEAVRELAMCVEQVLTHSRQAAALR